MREKGGKLLHTPCSANSRMGVVEWATIRLWATQQGPNLVIKDANLNVVVVLVTLTHLL